MHIVPACLQDPGEKMQTSLGYIVRFSTNKQTNKQTRKTNTDEATRKLAWEDAS
jgi:hypothetical protein